MSNIPPTSYMDFHSNKKRKEKKRKEKKRKEKKRKEKRKKKRKEKCPQCLLSQIWNTRLR